MRRRGRSRKVAVRTVAQSNSRTGKVDLAAAEHKGDSTEIDHVSTSTSTLGAGVPWHGTGVPWHGAGVPWLGAGLPWVGAGVP